MKGSRISLHYGRGRKPVKTRFIFLSMTAIFFVSCAHNSVGPGSKEVARVEAAIKVLEGIMDIPEESIPMSLLRKAYSLAIIPRTIKAGFGVGGRHGRGILVVHPKGDGWSNPSFIVLYGGSIGVQVGAQSTDFVLVFSRSESIEAIEKTKFILGAKASAAAGLWGVTLRWAPTKSSRRKSARTREAEGCSVESPWREPLWRSTTEQIGPFTVKEVLPLEIFSRKKGYLFPPSQTGSNRC